MAEPAARLTVPRLLSGSTTTWLALAAAVVAVPAVVGWAFATQPAGNRVAALVLAVAFAGFVAWVGLRRTWLDTRRGLVVHENLLVLRRSTAWADAETVRFTPNRAGQVLLEVRGSGRPTYLPLVAVDVGGDRCQPPGVLRLLADQVETWAPSRTAVVRGLRAQAAHVEGGGDVRESPLARAHLART